MEAAAALHQDINHFNLAERALPGAGLGGYALPEDVRFVFADGKRARIHDVEGREFVDYVGGAGALILGHSHPVIVKAVQIQAERGLHIFGVLNDQAINLADRLVDTIPCAERIAFATTGSEATGYAMRMARAYTGRDKILKFEGAYHGNHDYAQISVSPNVLANYPVGRPDTAGTPTATASTVLISPYNDLEAVEQIIRENRDDLAAIIVEPVQRIIKPAAGFLEGLRSLCDNYGLVLIFDEVVTGFRLSLKSAQGYFGVTPDLASFGKVIGAGGPLSVVAGKADIIDLADPNQKSNPRYAMVNGTLHGNPVAAAATLALLDELAKPNVYDALNAATEGFCINCQEVLERHHIPAICTNVGSLWQILFMTSPPRHYADVLASDNTRMKQLDIELLKRRQYVLPGVRRFMSAVHDERDLAETLNALEDACKVIA